MADRQIRMYGTRWCPDCARAKQVLNNKKVEYVYVDIEQDSEAMAYVQKVNNGFKSVPTIIFPDGSVLVEPNNAELEKKIAALSS